MRREISRQLESSETDGAGCLVKVAQQHALDRGQPFLRGGRNDATPVTSWLIGTGLVSRTPRHMRLAMTNRGGAAAMPAKRPPGEFVLSPNGPSAVRAALVSCKGPALQPRFDETTPDMP